MPLLLWMTWSMPQHRAEIGVFPLSATMRFPLAERSGLEIQFPFSLSMALFPWWAVRHPPDLIALRTARLSLCGVVGWAGTGGDSNDELHSTP